MFETFTVEETNRLVWGPDLLGCIAFLVGAFLLLPPAGSSAEAAAVA